MTFDVYWSERKESIQAYLKVYLEGKTSLQKEVYEAMLYSVMAGGKRLRPLILEESFKLFKDEDETIHAFVAAIEMIHTYSLIHDDLPAMDDDELRRGKPTCHVAFGEDIAILAGDALLNLAFEVMLEATLKYDLGKKGLKAMQCLANKAGAEGMIGGQIVDITTEGKKVGQEVVDFIHLYKTSALIEAAFMMGGFLAGVDKETIMRLERIGRFIGLAFQIQDDILDVTSSEERLGKPINSDKKNHKTTYIDLKGLEISREDVSNYLTQADREITRLGSDKVDFMKDLVEFIRNRDY